MNWIESKLVITCSISRLGLRILWRLASTWGDFKRRCCFNLVTPRSTTLQNNAWNEINNSFEFTWRFSLNKYLMWLFESTRPRPTISGAEKKMKYNTIDLLLWGVWSIGIYGIARSRRVCCRVETRRCFSAHHGLVSSQSSRATSEVFEGEDTSQKYRSLVLENSC